MMEETTWTQERRGRSVSIGREHIPVRRSGGRVGRRGRLVLQGYRGYPVIEVKLVPSDGLSEPLDLLARSLREGEPVPGSFLQQLREAVESGYVEVLVASPRDLPVGVVVISYHLNVSAAGIFASIEDLYVVPGFRRRGIGRALLEAASERCAARGVSYVEAQVEEEGAAAFYEAVGYEPETGVRLFSRSYAL